MHSSLTRLENPESSSRFILNGSPVPKAAIPTHLRSLHRPVGTWDLLLLFAAFLWVQLSHYLCHGLSAVHCLPSQTSYCLTQPVHGRLPGPAQCPQCAVCCGRRQCQPPNISGPHSLGTR